MHRTKSKSNDETPVPICTVSQVLPEASQAEKQGSIPRATAGPLPLLY